MRIFCTGVSGYIGGSIVVALASAGHEVSGLVRSERSADQVQALGIVPVHGTLDDLDVLRTAAARADVVLNAANADHEPSVWAMLKALKFTGKAFIHHQRVQYCRDTIGRKTCRRNFQRGHADYSVDRASRTRCIERAHPVLQGQRRSLGHHLSKSNLWYRPRAKQAQRASSMAYRVGQERWRR